MEKIISIFKSIRPIDIIIVSGLVIALIVGFFTYTNMRQTADKQIEATSKIMFDVFVRGVALTGEGLPIKKDEKVFISIRNVPYSDLKIIDVKSDRKKTILPTFNSKKVIVVEDISQANLYDIVVTLEDVANEVHLAPSYFSTLFKQSTGSSFREYLNMVRIEESKRLLMTTEHSISDIALATGFEDQSYFTKIFKKHTGLTPKQYR